LQNDNKIYIVGSLKPLFDKDVEFVDKETLEKVIIENLK
jgi:hypothetical protein